jgi:hypothetical protein
VVSLPVISVLHPRSHPATHRIGQAHQGIAFLFAHATHFPGSHLPLAQLADLNPLLISNDHRDDE